MDMNMYWRAALGEPQKTALIPTVVFVFVFQTRIIPPQPYLPCGTVGLREIYTYRRVVATIVALSNYITYSV